MHYYGNQTSSRLMEQAEKERAAAAAGMAERERVGLRGGAALGGYASDANQQRSAELPAAVEMMERGLCYLEESVSELAARLMGVLQPPVPEPASPEQIRGGGTPASGYASTIHAQGMRLAVLRERVQDLLRRLEV